jgi:hypothetical protein
MASTITPRKFDFAKSYVKHDKRIRRLEVSAKPTVAIKAPVGYLAQYAAAVGSSAASSWTPSDLAWESSGDPADTIGIELESTSLAIPTPNLFWWANVLITLTLAEDLVSGDCLQWFPSGLEGTAAAAAALAPVDTQQSIEASIFGATGPETTIGPGISTIATALGTTFEVVGVQITVMATQAATAQGFPYGLS